MDNKFEDKIIRLRNFIAIFAPSFNRKMEEKRQIRLEVKRRKRMIGAEERALRSEKALRILEQDKRFIEANVIVSYFPLPDELDTLNLLRCYAGDKMLLLPVVDGNDIRLKPYEGELQMLTGAFGIAEPSTSAYFTDYDRIDLVIVPGVAFTPAGIRLGRGRGYYDRFLPLLPNAFRIGVAYDFQLFEKLPSEPHDCRMDAVITG